MINENLKKLMSIAPPPTNPVANGNPSQWGEIEKSIGTCLPEDYKQFFNLYGKGRFGWSLVPITPFSNDNVVSGADDYYIGWIEAGRDNYEGMKNSFGKHAPEKFPFTTYPPLGGLLAIGALNTGGTIYYLTAENPEDWSIVVYDEEFFEFEHHEMPLTAFLYNWLTGNLETFLLEEEVENIIPPLFKPTGQRCR